MQPNPKIRNYQSNKYIHEQETLRGALVTFRVVWKSLNYISKCYTSITATLQPRYAVCKNSSGVKIISRTVIERLMVVKKSADTVGNQWDITEEYSTIKPSTMDG